MKKLSDLLKETEDTNKYLKIWADKTNNAARETTTGRVGDKVLINHVAMTCDIDPAQDVKKYQQFKDILLQAQRAGYVSLSRADLGPSGYKRFGITPEDIKQSQINYMNAEWNFVRPK